MNYCIYAFVDEEDNPYYIGKTKNYNKRYKDHLFEVKTKNMLPKYIQARKLFGEGHSFKMKKIGGSCY